MHDLTEASNLTIRSQYKGEDQTFREFLHHSSGQRIFTDTVLVDSLAKQYPGLPITLVENENCNLFGLAATGAAEVVPVQESPISPLASRGYALPLRRMDGDAGGSMMTHLIFGKYLYKYKGKEYILYVSSGRDGADSFGQLSSQILVGPQPEVADELIRAATKYSQELRNEIWVFDGGLWRKSAELYRSVAKARWEDVILDEDMKKNIQEDVLRFFASRDSYEKLRVPWKRGIIYYGPPGNGKTVSIKAMMHSLDSLPEPVPTLYIRSLNSIGGPEYSISQIFARARQQAPCLLVFEDLDSLVRDNARTYFLNEVDGLQVNEGVLMIGSTNYLDRLDPGISKRPSRFDRKYYFPKPSHDERVLYCEYWRTKLADNEDVDFPHALSEAIAKITDDFSFAFMQEAFIASLLILAHQDDEPAPRSGEGESISSEKQPLLAVQDPELPHDASHTQIEQAKRKAIERLDLEKLPLWRVIKKQIEILREEI